MDMPGLGNQQRLRHQLCFFTHGPIKYNNFWLSYLA